jgi:hypothetical protein
MMSSLKDLEKNEIWIGLGLLVGGFVAGFASCRTLIAVTGQEVLANGTFVLRSELEKDFVSRKDCEPRLTLGYDYTVLVGHLLNLLDPASVDDLARWSQSGHCRSDFIEPGVKVELIAYLNSGDPKLRRKAILAFAWCGLSLNEAFVLARTVRAEETDANMEAYALAMLILAENDAKHFPGMRGLDGNIKALGAYLAELGAPAEILSMLQAYRYQRDKRELGVFP